jgi:hypothetical protein
MSARSLGTFLLLEGAIVAALLVTRALCLRIVPLEALPLTLRRHVERGNRAVPLVVLLVLLAVLIGGVLRVGA